MDAATLASLQQAAGMLQRGDPASALGVCDAILASDAANAEALHLRAMACGKLGRIDDAAHAFEAAARLHPRKDAILVNYGNALKAAGQLEAARDVYERAVAALPQSAPAWTALGLAQRQLGQDEEAEAALKTALKHQPDYAAALSNLGSLHQAAGRLDEAIACFSQALKTSPQMLAALLNRGAALRKAGRMEEAIADHTKAVKLAPGLAECRHQLGASLAMAGDFGAASSALQRALQIDPAHAAARRDLVRALWETGRQRDVFDMLDAAIEKRKTVDLLVLRAELCFRSADPQAAVAAAREALAVAPDNPQALGLLAQAAQALGDRAEALNSARRAADVAPSDYALRHTCAEIELGQGLYQEAAARLSGAAPQEHLQRHIALKALAWRALGDSEYKRYYDYDRFTAQIAIEAPQGFASVEEFNAALRAAIEPLHRTTNAPLDQTLYGGTQSPGRLWANPDPVIQSYVGAVMAAARKFVSDLPDDSEHPFLARKSLDLACAGAWSVILSSGGGHVDHFHPAGWISASYYVDTPEEVLASDRAGFLRLGASGVRGLDLPAERWFRPAPGTVVFFPSYVWHGVEPFRSDRVRVAAPFDLAPV